MATTTFEIGIRSAVDEEVLGEIVDEHARQIAEELKGLTNRPFTVDLGGILIHQEPRK